MTTPELLVGLRNPIDAFDLKPDQLQQLVNGVGDAYNVVLAKDKQDFIEHLPTAHRIICWKFNADWYAQAPNLTHIHTPAAGHDWVAPDPSGKVAIDFGTFHGPLMREALVAMMLYFNRRLDVAVLDKANKVWDRNRYSGFTTLRGQQVGILGYGTIGRSCAELLTSFGCRITGVKRTVSSADSDGVAERIVTIDSLPDILPEVDHLVCILPGDPGTERLVTADHFSIMKQGAYLYNLGRGNCYAEEDLVRALENGPLAGAGLDVFAKEPLPESSPLWQMDNAFILPHASAICRDYLPAFIDEVTPKLLSI